jgi:glycosyltransferase involved in cell wall biosynthesis
VKVAIVAPLVAPIREPQRGGSQVFVSDLARGLVDRGHEVDLYAASGSVLAGVRTIDTGVDHRGLQATLYRPSGAGAGAGAGGLDMAEKAFAGVYGAVRDAGYDVVHNHAFDAPAVALATDLQAPVLHTLHLPPRAEVVEALLQSVAGSQPPAVACVSEHQAKAWRALVRVDAILPPLVPTAAIPFSLAAGNGAVFAGRFSPEKGAVEAIEIARAAGVRVELFGDSYDDEYTRDEIDPHRAEPGVSVHAGVPRSSLWQVMARAAVVLCPANWEEPFGMAAAEAQACGTPVVAFRRGALAEVVVDRVTGFLIAPGDIGAAADAVLRTAGLSRRQCRAHAEAQLDLAWTLDAHERLYEQLAGAHAGVASGG